MRFEVNNFDDVEEINILRRIKILENLKRTQRRISNISRAKTIVLSILSASVIGVYIFGYLLPLQAATKTWDGGGIDNNWSTCANWNADTCPAAADTVIFDGTSSKDVTVDATFAGTIATVNINSGYGGTITLARSFTVSTAFSQAAGTFTGASQTMSVVAFTLSGGTFTSTSGTMSVSSNFTVSGSPTFNNNSGTITFNGGGGVTQTLSCNSITFNLVNITRSGNNATTVVNSNCSLPLGNNPTLGLAAAGNGGIMTLNGTLSGTGTMSVISNTNIGQFTVNTGAAITGFSGFTASASGINITIAGATIDFSTYTTFNFNGALTISSGSLILPAPTGAGIVIGAFTLSAGSFTASPGLMSVSGNFTISSGTTFNANGGTITFNGNGGITQTLSCNNVSFNQVNISRLLNNATTTVNSNCSLPLGNNPTLGIAAAGNFGTLNLNGTITGTGTLSVISNTTGGGINFNTGGAITGFSGLSAVATGMNINVAGGNVDFSSYTTFALNGNISISSGSLILPSATGALTVPTYSQTGGTFTASPSTMSVTGFSISGTTTFNANGGTVAFVGGSGTITCNNVTFNLVTISRTSNTTFNTGCNLPLGNNPTITQAGNASLTFGGTLSGTGTLTESGAANSFLEFTAGGGLSGFSGLSSIGGLSLTGVTMNLSSYTTFSITGSALSMISSTLSLPPVTGSLQVGTFVQTNSTFTSTSSTLGVSQSFTISGTTTFNANGGTVAFNGGSATISCNNVTFNLVTISKISNTTFNTGCNLPLGNNPTITQSGNASLSFGGTISGTGTLNFAGAANSFFEFIANGAISGFTGLTSVGGLNVTSTTIDLSAYTTFSIPSGQISLTSATLSLPAVTGSFQLSSFAQTNSTFTASPSTMNVSGSFSISGTTTFNANGGNIVLNGASSGNITCNSSTFNTVTISKTAGSYNVNSGCNLPLGSNPTIGIGASLTLAGTLTGTGAITTTGSGGFLVLNSGAVLSGFNALTVTSANLTVSGATFNASSYSSLTVGSTLSVSSGSLSLPATASTFALTLSGGTLTSSSGTLTIGNALTVTGSPTFNHNSGNVTFTGSSATLSCGNVSFNQVTLTNAGLLTINSNCSFPLGSNPTIANSVTLNGTLTGSGTATMTTGLLTLNTGSSITSFTGLVLPALTLAGASINFSTFTTFTVSGAVAVNSGTLTVPSGTAFNSTLSIAGGTFATTTGNISVASTLSITSGTFNAPTGNLTVGGALTISGSPVFNNNSGTVIFTGSGVTLSCNSVSFNNVVINNTGTITVNSNCSLPLGSNPTIANSVTLNGTLSGTNTLTNSTGTLTLASGSTLSGFNGLALSNFNLTGTGNYSGYSTFTASGSVTVNASSTLSLPSGSNISGALTVSGASAVLAATTGDITVGGTVTLATGTITAPSGNFNIGGNFVHTSGTFTHNSGTVVFNGTSQTISGIATTFSKFTKIVPTGSAQTLTFPASVTTTMLGAVTFNGFDTSARLLLRSSSAGTRFSIDAQSTRNLLYLDVKDSNNSNASAMQVGGTGSIDSANNIAWNFGSLTPNDPSSLGSSNVISNVYALTLKPAFTFTMSDPNALDTVKYQIQVSTVSNYASTVIDFTSDFLSQSTRTFTTGQSAGSGTYTVGSAGQSLASGSYYWRVRITDNNGLVSGYTTANSGSVAFLIDADVPASFTPTLNVTSPTQNTTPQVTFSTTDNVAVDHYQVKIDAGSFVTRTSPYTTSTLSNGAHTITVRAFDTTGNTTDGVVNITVDTSLPNVFTPTLNVTSPTSNQTPQVSFSTTDNDGIDHYEVKIDAGSFVTQTSPYTLPTLATGAHTITVRAFDTAGNTRDGSVNVTIDITGPNAFTPTFNVSSPTANVTPQVIFSASDTNGIDHYEVDIDGNGFSTQSSPYTSPALSNGVHTFTVRAFDNAGNTTDGSNSITIDTSGPVAFTPTLSVSSPTNNQTPDLLFSTTSTYGIDHYEVKIDGGLFTTQTSPYTLPTLSSGAHTLTVRAFDNNSNTIDGSVNVTIDITSPNAFTPNFSAGAITNDTTPRVTFSTSDTNGINHYEVSIDGGAFVTQSSAYDLPVQTQGTHQVIVRAFDNAGNSTDSSAATIIIDTTAPDAFTPTLNVVSPTTDSAPIVTFSTTDNNAINFYQVKIDGGSFTTRTSPYQLPTLANGAHTITVRAYDTAGNSTDGSVNVTVDVSFPDAFTPTLNVISPTTNNAPILSFSTTDDVGIDHYEVKIDTGSFSTQTSPYQLPTLTSGAHTITVRAFNVSGNTTDGTVNVTVDTTAPDINPNVPRTVYNIDITNTTINVHDAIGITAASVNATGGVINCTQSGSFNVNCTVTISATGTLHINATDNAGNVNSQDIADYVIEAVAPVITITAPTKSSSTTITDTTVNVTDDYGIDASDVVAISGGSINCSQTNFTTVDCTATVSVSGDLVVNANDLATNAASESETNYVVSSAAPLAFTPTLNVSSPTSNNAPILFFSTTDSDGIDRYEVKIDSGSFTVEVSPYQLPTLSDGFHTFTVRAFDTIGNFTDGVKTLTVDTNGPAAFTPTLNVTSPTNNTTPILSFITTDGGGINHYEVKIDLGSFITRTSPYQLPSQTAGSHTYTVRAFDNTGNFTDGSVNLVVNTQAPAAFTPTLNVSSPTNNTTPELSFSTTDDLGIDHYEVKIDSGSFVTQSSPYSLPSQTQGDHTYTVRAFDASGNTTDGSVNLTIDTTAPADFTPTLNVTSPTNNQTPELTFSTTDNIAISHYEVDIDNEGFITTTSPYTIPTLADGNHTITVKAFDTAGNSKESSLSVEINTSGPAAFTPTLDVTSPTNNTTPTVSFITTSDVGIDHYEVKVDGGSFTTQTSPYLLQTLAQGVHTITVRAFDLSSNTRDGSVTVTIDLTAPNTFTPTINSPTNDTTPDLTFSTTDNIGVDHYQVQVDSGSFTTQTSVYTLPVLTDGSHSITVVAYDAAGNTRNANVNVIIDTAVPVISFNAPTLTSNSTITNTTIHITDNNGILVSGITVTGGTLNCTQTNSVTVDCTSVVTTSGDLNIVATDQASNQASNSSTGYIIDSIGPVITITAPTKNSTNTISDTTIHVVDNYGLNAVNVTATGGLIACTQIDSVTVDCTASISASGNLNVDATDNFSNNSTQSETGYVIGTSLSIPLSFTPTLNTGFITTNKTPIVSFFTTDTDGINRYELRVDNGSFTIQSSPYQLSELSEGFQSILVRAYSNNGNYVDGLVNVIIDTIKPTNINIDLDVDSPTNNTRPTIYFSASDVNGIDHYEVKVASEGGVFETHTSPYQIDYDLDEEQHTITVKAFDKAGNVLEASVDLLVDLTAPTGTMIINNDEKDTFTKKVNLSFNSKDNLSGVAQMMISENSDFIDSYFEAYSTGKEFILSNGGGQKTIYVKFKDAAGNVSDVYSDSINYIENINDLPNLPVNDSNNQTTFAESVSIIIKNITDNLPVGLAAAAVVGITANLIMYPKFIAYGLFLIRLRKKKKNWGIVYNKTTREPVSFATVRIYSAIDKKFIAERITDFEGRYGFVVDKGFYNLEVKQNDYLPYTANIEYRNDEGLITSDIALIPVIKTKKFSLNIKSKLFIINAILVYLGFALSIVAIIFQQTALNIVVIIMYAIQFTIYRIINRPKREWGYIYNSKTNKRVKGAFVRIYDANVNRQVEVVITDENGRYAFNNLRDGDYLINVYAEGYSYPTKIKTTNNLIIGPTGLAFIKVKVVKGSKVNLTIAIDPV